MYLPLDYCKGICEEIDDEMEKCLLEKQQVIIQFQLTIKIEE